MEEEHEVQLYVYDLSRGLARTLSPVLLGTQIDGVWHTGIVVYGEEYYFGGAIGIESCPPGGTILGAPTQVVSLGKTQLTKDIFMDFLHELSQTSFRPECYHLFDHNCNTFSNEAANFLTGQNIPAHITSLPQHVLQTPFGAMLKPFVDSMTAGPQGGHALFNDDASAAAAAPDSQSPQQSSSSSVPSAPRAAEAPLPSPELVTYRNSEIIENYNQQKDQLRGALRPADSQLVAEVCEYLLVTGEHDWSLSSSHINAFCQLINDTSVPSAVRQLLAGLLESSLLSEDVVAIYCHGNGDSPFVRLINRLEMLPEDIAITLAKCICNLVSTKPGADWFGELRSCPESPDGKSGSGESTRLLAVVCHHCLLHTRRDIRLIGSHIASNYLRHAQVLSPDSAFDLGVTLIEACKHADSESADFLWYCLCTCIRSNTELAVLAEASELNINDETSKYPTISKYTSAISKCLANSEIN